MRRAPSSVVLVKARGLWCLCVLLVMPLCPRAQLTSEQDLDYLELQSVPGRHLAQTGEGAPAKHPCHALKAGAPVPGQFVLMFDPDKVDTIDQGISLLQQAFAGGRSSGDAESSPTAKALPFDIVKTFPGEKTTSSSSSSTGQRRLQQSNTGPSLPLGVVITASDDAVNVIKSMQTVQYITNDVCVKVAQDITAARTASVEFGCLPASQVSGITIMPLPESLWPGCFVPGARLAWWGERCGPSNSQIQWMGVYAYNGITGDRLSNCIRARPTSGNLSDDERYWLGDGCGDAPGAVPNMPRLVCSDPFTADTCAATSTTPEACPNQNCIPFGGPVQQTVQIMHPSETCKQRKPMMMKFVGERCYSGGGAAVNAAMSSQAAVRWLSAVPAEEVEDPAGCSMSRMTGATLEELVYNQNYFGGCGVPPARIQYLAWGECPAAPPPASPPPPAPPPPRVRTLLPRENVETGSQTISTGVKRVLAVTSQDGGPLQTVKQLKPTSVAILDTGIECGHPDLNILHVKAFNTELNPDSGKEPACYDGLGHGTHVAGIIGARNNQLGVVGVLPNTPIVALKVLDAEGVGTYADILSALAWLLEPNFKDDQPNPDGLTNAEAFNVDVVSMSLGFYVSSITTDVGFTTCNLLKTIIDQGMVVVAAASNDNEPLNNVAPACCPGVIAATSMNPGSGAINPQQQASWFSNYLWLQKSPTYLPWTPEKLATTVAAPGSSINSTCSVWRDRSGYCTLSGTSQSTPHIAGIFARCFSTGECVKSLGSSNVQVGLSEFKGYNTQVNPDFGFQQDPIRSPTSSVKFYGYLAYAGGW